MEDFDHCIAVDPHLPGPYFNRAVVHDALGEVALEMPGFDELIGEGRMRFELSAGFQEAKQRTNPLFPYDKAVRKDDGSLEIRYAVRPLGRIQIDYEDPHSSAPDPNHMFPLMFQSLVTMLSNGRHSPTREYPKELARKRFNADWAAAAVFDVSPDFNVDHKQALVIALHKNHLADAYSIFLFDDYAQVKQQIDGNLSSLAFLPE
jgi:hypothetical protein